MPEAFDEIALELEAGELGDIVETPYGFHIVKCIVDFEERETALNKKRLLKEKQMEEFEKIYEDYTKKQQIHVKTDRWEKVSLESMEELKTGSFFQNYETYFKTEKQEQAFLQ